MIWTITDPSVLLRGIKDVASTQTYTKWLKATFSSGRSKNMAKVETLMKLTLYKRKADVIDENMSVPDFLKKYLWLGKTCENMCTDFTHITNKLVHTYNKWSHGTATEPNCYPDIQSSSYYTSPSYNHLTIWEATRGKEEKQAVVRHVVGQ